MPTRHGFVNICRAAQHLFFLRALHESKRARGLTNAPDVCGTEFPTVHRDILLRRIYPDA